MTVKDEGTLYVIPGATAFEVADNSITEAKLAPEIRQELSDIETGQAAQNRQLAAIEADDWVTGRRIAAKTIGSGNLVDTIIDEDRPSPNLSLIHI